MSDIAERIKYLCKQANDAGNHHAGPYIRDLGDLVVEHAPTILAALEADPSSEIARLRADAERKDEALKAAYSTMLSARRALRDAAYTDTLWPGRLKEAADECESTGRKITAALADTADKPNEGG